MIDRPSEAVGSTGIALLREDLTETLGPTPASRFAESAVLAIAGRDGLFDRARAIANVLNPFLPTTRSSAANMLVESSGPPLERPGYGPMANYRRLVFTTSASVLLADDTPLLLETLRQLTMSFTAEFEVRAVLARDYRTTYETLRDWTRDTNYHVRRLASEGVRPRLPWSRRLNRYQEDPRDLIKLIAPLRHDPSPYVRRSVANNLGDVLKDNPDTGYQTLWEWLMEDASDRTIRQLVRWAIRYPARRGDPEAAAFGLWHQHNPNQGTETETATATPPSAIESRR